MIPELLVYIIVFAEPTINSPWTLLKINSLASPILAIVSLALVPTDAFPIASIPRTSPTL